MDEFAQALSLADKVVLADIYAARETDTLGISSKDLQEKISLLGTDAHYFSTFDEIEDFLLENCIPQDLLITMGAAMFIKSENICSGCKNLYTLQAFLIVKRTSQSASLLAHERSRFAICQWELSTPTGRSIPLTRRLVLCALEAGECLSAFNLRKCLQVFCQKMLILFSKILCYTELGHRLIRKGCWKWDSLHSVMIFPEITL